jgi:hypothetical protein
MAGCCHVYCRHVRARQEINLWVLQIFKLNFITCCLLLTQMRIQLHVYPSVVHGLDSVHFDSLWAGWCGDRILVGVRFFASIQTGPGGHPASCIMGAEFFSEGKEAGVWQPPTPSSTEVKDRVELYLYSPSGTSWPVLGWTLLYRRKGYHTLKFQICHFLKCCPKSVEPITCHYRLSHTFFL